jgi:F-type H+-transporting ATPase subunit b
MALLLPETGLLFWMLISFGIVVFILVKFGFPVILDMIDKRDKYVADSLHAAEAARHKLERLEEDAKGIISGAHSEQMQILKEAARIKDEIVAQAKEQAGITTSKLIAEARQAIAKEREDALKDIRKQVAILSLEVAEKLLRKELDNRSKQMEFIDILLDEINVNK